MLRLGRTSGFLRTRQLRRGDANLLIDDEIVVGPLAQLRRALRPHADRFASHASDLSHTRVCGSIGPPLRPTDWCSSRRNVAW